MYPIFGVHYYLIDHFFVKKLPQVNLIDRVVNLWQVPRFSQVLYNVNMEDYADLEVIRSAQ